MEKRFGFIFNPHAGKSDTHTQKTIEHFIATHMRNSTLAFTKGKNHATELAQSFAEAGFTPVAVGGDGTVNEVAKALLHTEKCMGIIPKGSGNGVARHLGIPMNLNRALQTLITGTIHNVDSGKVNEHPFVMLMGVGFDAMVAKAMSKETQRGLLKYAKLAIQTFGKFEPLELQFEIDGKAYRESAFMFNVSNASQFGNNFYHAPKANMQDGLLNVSLLKPFPLWLAPDIALRMTRKQIESSAHYVALPVQEVKIANVVDYINLDGESVPLHDSLHVQVNPKSLHIIAP